MTRYDDETLMRRIDGELTSEQGDCIDAEALSDPDLAARLQAMRRLRGAAREAFPVQPDPRDQALAQMIAGAAPTRAAAPLTRISDLFRDAFAPKRAAIWGGLAVAAFVGGLMIGPLLGGSNSAVVLAPSGEIADAGLVRVLDHGLASDGPDAAGRAVALTYRDVDGRWCRTFRAGEAGVAGLACRDEDRWAIRALAPLGSATGELRTAGADTPLAILSAVDAGLSGETLDATSEARARDGGWR